MKYWFTLCFSFFFALGHAQIEQHFDLDLEWIEENGEFRLLDGQPTANIPGAWSYTVTFPLPGNAQISAELNVMEESLSPKSQIQGLSSNYHVQAWPSSDRGEFTGVVTIIANRATGNEVYHLLRADLKVVFTNRNVAGAIPDPKRESILATGSIFKLGIANSGLHKITAAQLSSRLNLSINDIDPEKLELLGNPGGPLPWSNDAVRNDDLEPIPYKWYGLQDGRLDANDYMIFYAEGADVWIPAGERWERSVNPYEDLNYVFIRLASDEYLPVTYINSIDQGNLKTTYSDRQYYGKAESNLLGKSIEHQGSGILWVSDQLSNTRTIDLSDSFDFTDLDLTQPLYVNSHVYGRSEQSSTFELHMADTTFTKRVSSISLDIEAQYASRGVFSGWVSVNNEDINIRLDYPEIGRESFGWLDYMTIIARKQAIYRNKPLYLTDTFGVSQGGFSIPKFGNDYEIWDITHINQVVEINAQDEGQNIVFRVDQPNQREFVAFDPDGEGFLEPVSYEAIANQNLHALDDVDMITIYHPLFKEQAERHANHRMSHDNMKVALVNVKNIYNEFSSGRQDPTAIRDLLRMLYIRSNRFRYCLLFGDGSYDYRHQDKTHEDQNFVPVFETENSLHPIFAYPTDDFYTFLDAGEGGNLSGSMDIAIGRFTCRNEEEAKILVDKVIHYDTAPATLGDWRNRLVFLADDEDSNQHASDIERLAKQANEEHFEYNQDKIYFDAYPQVSTPGGTRFPEANEAINTATFKGALSFTYLGHGGPTGLAQERVLQVKDILSWENKDRLPIIITATCSFTAYDEPTITSAGEHSILSRKGGAIAILSTVRAVYANDNYRLTRAAQEFLYDENNGQQYRLGEVLRLAKNSVQGGSQDSNNRKFSLFGDPSLRLALPRYHVSTTKINDEDVQSFSDTLGALDRVKLEGFILDDNGNVLNDFQGTINVTLFDKPITLSTKGTDIGSRPMDFELQKNVLFKGGSTVQDGQWSIDFVLPKDLNFTIGQGKVSYYAHDGNIRDANGYLNTLTIGGSGNQNVVDDQGPKVEVFMNDENFVFGGITSPNPILFVKLSDDNGINVVGNSIGHDLTGVLDYNTQNTFILNDFYEADENDSRKGVVRYPLFNLEDGRHHIEVTAWDIANNFSEGSTEFVVVSDASSSIQNVLSYPNPFSDYTVFGFEHNFPPGEAEIDVIIVNAAGQEVNRIEKKFDVAGFRVTEITWDGTDYSGNKVPNGVYLYKIIMKRNVFSANRTKESSFERVVVLK